MVAEVNVSQSEFKAQCLNNTSFATALEYLQTDGYLVLHNVIERSHLQALQSAYDAAWQRYKAAKPTWIAGGQIIGHLNVVPPASEHLVNSAVLANKIICALSSAALGPDLRITGVGGNTNAPRSVDQYFHSDVDYKDFTKLVVNIPLGDVDESNGSIELVPFSHKADIHFPEPKDLSKASAPVRINTRMGSVLIRYPHVWHRGRSNLSGKPRHMLSAWHESIPHADQTDGCFLLDPSNTDILAAYTSMARNLGNFRSQPEFRPNYFSANMIGLIMEIFYRNAPETYLYLLRRMKRMKPSNRSNF